MVLDGVRESINRKVQMTLDRFTLYPIRRWASLLMLIALFIYRMYLKQGYAFLAYLLGLYYVNFVMLYLAPAEDPE